MGKPKVGFTLYDEQEKEDVRVYAKTRGFSSIGALARFALFQYMSRYPLKKSQGGTAERSESNI